MITFKLFFFTILILISAATTTTTENSTEKTSAIIENYGQDSLKTSGTDLSNSPSSKTKEAFLRIDIDSHGTSPIQTGYHQPYSPPHPSPGILEGIKVKEELKVKTKCRKIKVCEPQYKMKATKIQASLPIPIPLDPYWK